MSRFPMRPRVELKSKGSTQPPATGKEPIHEMKAVRFEIKDADKGLVTATFAEFNVKDHDGDWTLPGAFEEGAKVILGAYGHKSWMGVPPIGRGVIRVEKNLVMMDGEFFLNTMQGKETFELVKQLKDLQEWSYGFDVLETGELDETLRQKGVWRVLKKLKVYEVCPVLAGAMVGSETLSVKARTEAAEQASKEINKKARQEFARFMQTTSRLSQ